MGNVKDMLNLLYQYPVEGLTLSYKELAEKHANKVGVVSFHGSWQTIDIHDPVFMEKLQTKIPEVIDRQAFHGFLGQHITGLLTMIDYKTTKENMDYWH